MARWVGGEDEDEDEDEDEVIRGLGGRWGWGGRCSWRR